MPPLALIPLALQLAPALGRWLAGGEGEAVARNAAEIVATMTGADTPAGAEAALASNPELRAQVQIRLAEIAAEKESAREAAQLERLRAELADIADARRQTVTLAQAGNPLAYGAVLVSALVLLAYGAVVWLAMFKPIPAGSETLVNVLWGSLSVMAGSVVTYWVGSSAGSAEKTRLLTPGAPPPFAQAGRPGR